MKHTKNMIYKPTNESDDLFLCATLNSDIRRSHIEPILKNLIQKAKKENYNPEKAVDAWYVASTAQAAILTKQFGTRFTVSDRWTAAVDMEKDYREEISEAVNR